jgi:hypothetical protein
MSNTVYPRKSTDDSVGRWRYVFDENWMSRGSAGSGMFQAMQRVRVDAPWLPEARGLARSAHSYHSNVVAILFVCDLVFYNARTSVPSKSISFCQIGWSSITINSRIQRREEMKVPMRTKGRGSCVVDCAGRPRASRSAQRCFARIWDLRGATRRNASSFHNRERATQLPSPERTLVHDEASKIMQEL